MRHLRVIINQRAGIINQRAVLLISVRCIYGPDAVYTGLTRCIRAWRRYWPVAVIETWRRYWPVAVIDLA